MNYVCTVPGEEEEPTKPVADENIVTQLVSMGFNNLHCQKAAINTSNAGVEEAMNWLLSHMDDPGTCYLEFLTTIFSSWNAAFLLAIDGYSAVFVTLICYSRALNNTDPLFPFQI